MAELSAPVPLEALRCLRRLQVSAPRVEPRRISATYRTDGPAGTSEIALTYSYDEDFFDPEERSSHELASMILAQPALNYGLFCEEIVFAGAHDERDARFLEEAARNTAREIYVNKLHGKNPFLVGAAKELAFERRDSYLQAKLRFEGDNAPRPRGGERWDVAPDRYVVLSSGGKESLLSYGLLAEIAGPDKIAPTFVNESGRHWFSALNAHRRFAAEIKGTARVWTNVDRLFNWMLRQLPFVRPDYAKVRADMYPLRLWTVSCFVFGALPIARRRGAGSLVVGDEYDTTQRVSSRGVTHYNGLYDQSRYYDNALSRYYRGKGWDVTQFSLLRPLSELLIQKTLAERYPELLPLQVSCHAAHVEDGQVRPCGRCEKCRRIVVMLLALEEDPRRCGYQDKQIETIVSKLPERALHQERPAVETTAALMHERGMLPGKKIGGVEARQRSEVLSLRFDKERSPLDTVPEALRAPLFRVLLEHADGALLRREGYWEAFELQEEQA